MGHADYTTVYALTARSLSPPQVLPSDLAAIDSLCLKWHMRLNPKKTKPIVVSQSRTYALGYSDLILGGAKLEEVKSLRIL